MVYKNYLLKHLEEKEARLSRYRDSILFASEVHNYKDSRYSVEKLARELLRLTPFGHGDFRLLKRETESNMNRVVFDTMYKRNTKPHKNRILDAALRREFNKLRSKKKQTIRDKVISQNRKIKDNEISIVGGEFEIELINAIYSAKTPKTDQIYKQKMSAHIQVIQELEERGEQVLADELRSKPPVYDPIFKEVAQSIKKKYLTTVLSRRDVKRELAARMREVKEFAYPTLDDIYPKE